MLEVLTFVFSGLGTYGLYLILSHTIKFYAIHMVCKHSELSDEKVNYITRMLYKDKSYRKK
ncbi:MAG TPA: hypothetical protein DCW90_07505 [Lachnospiraceae bacterium]|nr:hypothetical protein [Lachnospiraceae bacterium]